MTDRAQRLMLVEPPFYRLYKTTYSLTKYPLALGYLAGAVLAQTPWSVQTYNADFCAAGEPMKVTHLAGEGFASYLRRLHDPGDSVWAEVAAAVRAYGPQVVGITAKTQNFASAMNVARIVKAIDPSIRVILGGPHASLAPVEALQACPEIDLVIRGEGEVTLVEVLRALAAGREVAGIPGTLTRAAQGRVLDHGVRPYLADLDQLPFPHETAAACLKDFAQYPAQAFQYVFATRACPFNCYFCGSRAVWGRQTRFRSAASVGREFASLRRMGVHHVHFDDDTFGVKPGHILDLCREIQTQAPGMTWSCELHVNLCKEPIVAAMARAGCTGVQVGVESGSDQMLKTIRKNTTVQSCLDACRLIRRYGMFLSTFFIIGFPRETEETLAQTVEVMRRIHSDRIIYSVFTPYPGTETFADCRSLGLIGTDFDVARFNHQSPENCFTAFIPRERFRELARRIERTVDRRNALSRARRFVQYGAVHRVKGLVGRIVGHDQLPLAASSSGFRGLNPGRAVTQLRPGASPRAPGVPASGQAA
jgi:tRNA A37 methylthiotransferase MiaB